MEGVFQRLMKKTYNLSSKHNEEEDDEDSVELRSDTMIKNKG